MTYSEFYRSYLNAKVTTKSYRLGQHFINLFVADEYTDPIFKGLWEKDGTEASEQIRQIIARYHWNELDLPLLRKELV